MITFVVGGWGEEGTLISYLEKRRGEVTLPFRIEFHCWLLRKSVAQAYPEEPAPVAVSDPKSGAASGCSRCLKFPFVFPATIMNIFLIVKETSSKLACLAEIKITSSRR